MRVSSYHTAYYVAFGPHGPRAPTSPPGSGIKTLVWVVGMVGIAGGIYASIRGFGESKLRIAFHCPPRRRRGSGH